MIWQNIEIHNAVEIFEDGEGIRWRRFPESVLSKTDNPSYSRLILSGVGVELRFVPGEGPVRITMDAPPGTNNMSMFTVFRGGIQGSWQDLEQNIVSRDGDRIVLSFTLPDNLEKLRKMAAAAKDPWDPAVVRVIFDRGGMKLISVEGDVRPPKPEECPAKTMFFYGSSITHASLSLTVASSFVSILGHRLKADTRNLGMPGNCDLNHAMADFIAEEGAAGHWDAAVLELGINVCRWEEERIRRESEYVIGTVAKRNPDKPVFVVSPFYAGIDFDGESCLDLWRRALRETVERLGCPNVTYVNGKDMPLDISGICADEVHPNVYGTVRIADGLEKVLHF